MERMDIINHPKRTKCEGSNHLKYTEEHDADAPVINLAVKDYLTSLTLSFDEE